METKTPENWKTSCVVCDEVITQPICLDCLEKEVVQWLITKGPDFIPLVRGVSEFFRSNEDEKKTVCILCGNRMNVCPYCYKNEVYELLNGLSEEFREIFFDYDMTGFLNGAS